MFSLAYCLSLVAILCSFSNKIIPQRHEARVVAEAQGGRRVPPGLPVAEARDAELVAEEKEALQREHHEAAGDVRVHERHLVPHSADELVDVGADQLPGDQARVDEGAGQDRQQRGQLHEAGVAIAAEAVQERRLPRVLVAEEEEGPEHAAILPTSNS